MRVFVSYSLDQKEAARELAAALRREGFDTWLDLENLRAGEKWHPQVIEAVNNAESFVVLIGPDLSLDYFQNILWRNAWQASWSNPMHKLLPVLLGGADLPPYLGNWLPVRVKQIDTDGVRTIVSALRGQGGGAAPPDLDALRKMLQRAT